MVVIIVEILLQIILFLWYNYKKWKGCSPMSTKLSDTAYDELLSRIISCKYPPGSLLSEEKLVAELGISRTPIRSALIRLQQEHLVQIISKKGILVSEITPEGIRDMFNLRNLIEPYAIREFGGNFSAFLAHIVLEYIKCKNCFSRQIGENCAPAPRRGKCAKVAENALAADDR